MLVPGLRKTSQTSNIQFTISASFMIVLLTRHCAMVILIALKENICSEYQRDPKVGKLFMAQDIRYINATRLILLSTVLHPSSVGC